jgi:CDGSH-type Zn-finger protein
VNPPGASGAEDPRGAAPAREAPPVEITVCPRGPLLIRGDVELVDGDGARIEAHRNTVALCRCGASATKPFCDGSHKLTRFGRPPRDATP